MTDFYIFINFMFSLIIPSRCDFQDHYMENVCISLYKNWGKKSSSVILRTYKPNIWGYWKEDQEFKATHGWAISLKTARLHESILINKTTKNKSKKKLKKVRTACSFSSKSLRIYILALVRFHFTFLLVLGIIGSLFLFILICCSF